MKTENEHKRGTGKKNDNEIPLYNYYYYGWVYFYGSQSANAFRGAIFHFWILKLFNYFTKQFYTILHEGNLFLNNTKTKNKKLFKYLHVKIYLYNDIKWHKTFNNSEFAKVDLQLTISQSKDSALGLDMITNCHIKISA